jgi:hypothetical protein
MKVIPKKEMEAIVYDGSNVDELKEFCGEENVDNEFVSKRVEVFTENGWIEVEVGDVVLDFFNDTSYNFIILSRETFDKHFKIVGV